MRIEKVHAEDGKQVKVSEDDIKTQVKSEDPGAQLIVKSGTGGHKIPLQGQLPGPDERLYHNLNTEKPKRKLQTLKVTFGEVTRQNFEQFRVLNYLTLPVIYSDDFYNRLTNYSRYSSLAYFKDVLVGSISCRFEED